MCIYFSTETYFTDFLSCMNIFVPWCQLPHPSVVSITFLQKIKQNMLHPGSCRLSLIYFLHIFTIITVFNNYKKENT